MIINLIKKYKEFILYAIFGILTTIVNVVAYFISTRMFHINIIGSTVIAWCLAVIFAYVTNRKYVFSSENHTTKAILIEFGAFISCRLFTGGIDVAIMYVFVDMLKMNDLLIKILSNIFVILSNYIASRLFIFTKHKHE